MEERDNLPVISFQSDDLLEKLKTLNYEKQLLSMNMKPLSRFFFVKSCNPGEQFYMFTLIAWWLCQKIGIDFDQPQEFDDPNITVAKIIQILQDIDLVGSMELHRNELIRGAGQTCIFVLDALSNQVLKVTKFAYMPPVIAQEDENASEYMEDNAEIILEKLNVASDEESDGEFDQDSLKTPNWIVAQNRSNIGIASNNNKNADADALQQWRLEIERVLPHLKVVVKSGRDWRSHLHQIVRLKTNVDDIAEDTQMQLKKMHNEFTFSMDKIDSREKHLNNELQGVIQHLKEFSIELSNIQYAQTALQKAQAEVLDELNNVITENDTKKLEMEQRGQSMADSSSVIHIRKAIQRLKDELSHLNLELTMLVQTLDQEILRQTTFSD